jgi:CBS-domain-containing membrane protein
MRHAPRPRSGPDFTATPAESTEIATIMTREVVTARKDDSFEALVTILVATGFSAVPIVDDRHRPIGIVTMIDALRAWRSAAARDGRESFPDGTFPPATARDVMESFVPTLPEHCSVAVAASAMAQLGIDWLVLVDPWRVVDGIVTTRDVARWVADGRARVD